MGLSTSTGILVSNSVIVLENIFRYKELGHNRMESAGKGTSEVTVAVLASTLTNIAVFLPLANMSGIMGQIMANFAYTVVIATVFSILVSFTLTPMLASLILPDKVKREMWISRQLEGMFKSWERGYRRMLEVTLARKRSSLIVVVVSLVALVGSFMLVPLLKLELMPQSDSGDITITIELPQGYDMEHTAAILDQIEGRVVNYSEVTTLLTNLGKTSSLNQGVNLATMGIKLVDKAVRSRSDLVLAADMTMVLSDIPNASIIVSAVSSGGDMGSAPVDFYLRGPEIEKLEGYSARLAKALKTVPGLMNVDTSSRGGKPEITFNPDRKKLSEAGITVNDLAVTLRAAIDGLVTTTYKEAGNEYDIRVMLKDRTLLTSADLKNIPVATSQGAQPISNFAEMRFAEGVGRILHTEKFKTIEFTASILPGFTQGDVTVPINERVKELNLPAGYFMTWAGRSQMLQDTVRDMIRVFLLAVILTYMLLAATMESFIQPFVILVTVPLALIGVIIICVWTGTTINMLAMLSIVMLVGIVVNNAILILDYTNQLKKGGMDVRSALIEACPTKLKPIIMANLAMILGTLPMALGIGASGAEMRIAMGIATIGGVVSSTIFTLFLIPSIERLIGKKSRVSIPAEAAL
jgi:hydrophobic/amphiphilic exporter-1 (mainly G- bacteria), HAE1 family